MKFFFWGAFNRRKIEQNCRLDWDNMKILRRDFIGSSCMIFLISLLSNAFMKRLDPPFFYDYYFRGIFAPKNLRVGTVTLTVAATVYQTLSNLSKSTFLFDTGLKYKNLLNESSLKDPITDSLIKLPTKDTAGAKDKT